MPHHLNFMRHIHCRFVPHFHPGAAEYFLGVRGKIELVAYINQQLVRSCKVWLSAHHLYSTELAQQFAWLAG